ncbi:MAG: DNA-3-methyladenine glycosylase I [Gammaproteobacteria bacterium]|nr:DNA-3-methyladenine glycosylase I [Gammaproteobacteria bacterium]MCZ6722423.1 DNA-3-methyladenine glycosylase I [Gammaproteobacteria bacterium]
MTDTDTKIRCWWCGDDELYRQYHDCEWGVPVHDDRLLFEFLCLEGAQAGLSWITILRKRENYRRLFDQFDACKIVSYDDTKIASLLADPGIVRNRLKVNGFVKNARAYLNMLDCGETLDDYLWAYVDGVSLQNEWSSMARIPANTPVSDAMSKDLKKRGFTFVGSTICYALMQAAGLVNDHVTDCFRHAELK